MLARIADEAKRSRHLPGGFQRPIGSVVGLWEQIKISPVMSKIECPHNFNIQIPLLLGVRNQLFWDCYI